VHFTVLIDGSGYFGRKTDWSAFEQAARETDAPGVDSIPYFRLARALRAQAIRRSWRLGKRRVEKCNKQQQNNTKSSEDDHGKTLKRFVLD